MNTLFTRETCERVLREKKPDVSENTIKIYAGSIMRIQREIGQATAEELDKWLAGLKPTQARNHMTPVAILFGEAQPQIRELFGKYNKKADNALDQQQLSASELENWISKKSVARMIARMREDCEIHKVFSGRLSEAKWRLRSSYVLWSLHFYFPWRNILGKCKVVETKKDVGALNCYVIREQSFYLSQFKTKNLFKRRGYTLPLVHRMPPFIAKLLKKHTRNRGADENFHLFESFNGKPLTKNAYSNLLTGASKKYLAKRIGSSLWRHIYLTEWSRHTRTLKERRAMAFTFHQVSLITQMRYNRPAINDAAL
jgi:hypothetical protein